MSTITMEKAQESQAGIKAAKKPPPTPFMAILILSLIFVHGLILYLVALTEMKNREKSLVRFDIQNISMPHPQTSDSLTAEGRQFFSEKRLDMALDSYNKAVNMNQKNRFARTGRGIILAETSRLNEAQQDFDRIKNEFPNKPEGYFGSAIVQAKRENYSKALTEINRALAIKPSEPQYLSDRGFILMNMKEYDKAKIDFENAIKSDKNNPYANMGMGEINRKQDNLKQSAYYYKKAIVLDPSIPKAQLFLASVYFDMDMFDESLDYYKAELDKIKLYGKIDDFQEAACFAEMSRIYAMIDKMELAKENLNNFYANVRLKDVFEGENDRDRSLLSDLGNACIEMGAHESSYYEKALQAYTTCLKYADKYDSDVNFYHCFQCGWCLWEMGKRKEALKYFKKALTYKQEGKGRYNYWMPGYVYAIFGKYDQALIYLNKSLEKDPEFENAYYTRAWVYCMKKMYDKARNDIDTVSELRKNGKCTLIIYRKSLELNKFIPEK